MTGGNWYNNKEYAETSTLRRINTKCHPDNEFNGLMKRSACYLVLWVLLDNIREVSVESI